MELNNWFLPCPSFLPGQSTSHGPAWDRTVFVLDNKPGQAAVYRYTDSLVNAIKSGAIPDRAHITFDNSQYFI